MSPAQAFDPLAVPVAEWTPGLRDGFFDGIAAQALDPMLTLLAQLRTDARPDKIDLGIGVYRDERARRRS